MTTLPLRLNMSRRPSFAVGSIMMAVDDDSLVVDEVTVSERRSSSI
jgi:hypothetical protein